MTINLKDARANLVRGHMRLSLGKKGSMDISETSLESIKESINLSDLEYEMPRFGRHGGGRAGPRGGSRGPPSRWGLLMTLKRDTGTQKYFNSDDMSKEQITTDIKEIGGE